MVVVVEVVVVVVVVVKVVEGVMVEVVAVGVVTEDEVAETNDNDVNGLLSPAVVVAVSAVLDTATAL